MENRLKILYLGYAINKVEAASLYGASVAGNTMQINILKQLSQYEDLQMFPISIYPIASFPKGKIYITKRKICLFDNFYSLRVALWNLPIMKLLFETIMTYAEAKKMIREEKISTIFTFNMFPQIGLPAVMLKRKYGCKIITLLADLPIDDKNNKNKIYYLLRGIFDYFTKNAIKKCDKIVALNQYAIDLYAPGITNLIIEGGLEKDEITKTPEKKWVKKNILFSGTLVEYNGIITLIEAMKLVKNTDVVLDIYGNGDLEEFVSKCAHTMNNVNYHGKIDYQILKQYQSEAYLLINPRPIQDPISMVTFPSKILEYMISGTPVLTTRLNGFTDEYLDKLYFTERDDPASLAEKIDEIISLPVTELQYKADIAREFVIEHKTWEMQCKKIVQFIKE